MKKKIKKQLPKEKKELGSWNPIKINQLNIHIMEVLNKKSAVLFQKIYSMLDKDGYLKLDRDGEQAKQKAAKNNNADIDKYRCGIMALFVKKVDVVKVGSIEYERISFAHYYECKGNLIADPEMMFLYNPSKADFIVPCYFLQPALSIEQNSIVFDENGVFKGYYPKMQADHTEFINSVWFDNIKWQQNL